MKTVIKSIPCLKLTVYTNLGYKGSITQRTQICYKAHAAAKFFSSFKNADWVNKAGIYDNVDKTSRSEFLDNVDHANLREARLYRRALKVFQNHLP
jgi:hypothetical protein